MVSDFLQFSTQPNKKPSLALADALWKENEAKLSFITLTKPLSVIPSVLYFVWENYMLSFIRMRQLIICHEKPYVMQNQQKDTSLALVYGK